MAERKDKFYERLAYAYPNEGDFVDAFLRRCGTTLVVAEKLEKRWIGSGLLKFTIQVTKNRSLDIYSINTLMDKEV
ncbi:MAG TPA: hypothetical protein PLW02_01065 [Verrucomicrobiota bacterium]|nr:hypothetical protein [Verrucomicrobiota bacterium]